MWRMRVVMVGALLVTSLGPGAGAARVPDPPRYKAYVVCGAQVSGTPAESCGVKQKKTAVLLSKDKNATYKICVKFPDKKRLCATHQQAKKGVKDGTAIFSSLPGRHKVTWFVGGTKVGTYTFVVND